MLFSKGVSEGFYIKIFNWWNFLASRNRYVFLCDAALLLLAVYVSFALRLSVLISGYGDEMFRAMAVFVPSVLIFLYVGGVYKIHWPQASVEEYSRLFKWYSGGWLAFALFDYFFSHTRIPRSAIVLMLLLGLSFITALRISWRLVRPAYQAGAKRKNAIIVGAGEHGAYLARDLLRRGHERIRPVGFVDEDDDKRGKLIAGLPVLGDTKNLPRYVREKNVSLVLLAIPNILGNSVKEYIDMLAPLGVRVRVLPHTRDIASGSVEVGGLRAVRLEDLLRREVVTLDEENIAHTISGKTALITGAGGSIGTEICMQAIAHEPKELLLLGHGEQSLYGLLENIAQSGINDGVSKPKVPIKPLVADVGDYETLSRIFANYKPDIVFHAAAHKHVPLMEENPRESVRVNALGTWNIAKLAGEHGSSRLVMISTDKAVNPTSVMGATKRMGERVLSRAQKMYPDTAYMAVRFGNVLGSRGSAIPKFEAQIANGGPVTVTDPQMRRYFMLIPEAVKLVLQAGSMGKGGELYVLDMGEPVYIDEMARTLIKLHGFKPDKDIKIIYTGIREGEKLFEELFYDPFHVDKTSHDKIFASLLSRDQKDDAILDEINALLGEKYSYESIFKEKIINMAHNRGL